MVGLVREEGDLGEQDAEGGGDEQLEPAVAQQDEAGDRDAETEGDRDADPRIEAWRASEQTALADDLGQLCIGLGDRGELGGAGVRLTNGTEAGLGDGGGDEGAPEGVPSGWPRRLPELRLTLRGRV
jgi:hypothetical protein